MVCRNKFRTLHERKDHRPYLGMKISICWRQNTGTVASTYFCISHSRLSSGHTFLVLSQREMQWKWNACYRYLESGRWTSIGLGIVGCARYRYPRRHCILQRSMKPGWLGNRCLTESYRSIHKPLNKASSKDSSHRSIMWFRQIAQLSTTMSASGRVRDTTTTQEDDKRTPSP
jgi:hypothetical protein